MIEIEINHGNIEMQFENEIVRNAVRCISYKNGKLLMIESKMLGDCKFPGGGIEKGENETEALIREVREESGYTISKIGNVICRIIESSKDKELDNTIFRMISDYYLCEVGDKTCELNLDDYERKLGFSPLWIGMDDAIDRNTEVMKGENSTKWIKRELLVLNEIKNRKIPLMITSAG